MLFRLSLTVDVGELDRGPLTVGTYVGMLIVLRLSKSGIECVILAGSCFFPLSEAEARFLAVMVVG